MEEKEIKELEGLIKEGEKLSSDIKYSSGGNLISPHYYFTDRSSYIEWLERCHYWISINNELCIPKIQVFYDNLTAKRVMKNDHPQLLNTLKAMLKYPQKNKPTISENKKENIGVSIYNTNTQSQNQSQEQKILQEIFIEAIKDDLTGKQQKELRAILDEHKDDVEKAKPKLVNKMLSFGKDVASNILANILTNPNIMGLF